MTKTWKTPPANFRFIVFERIYPAKYECRFYFVGWQLTLIDEGAVVRLFGRKGDAQCMISPQPYDSMDEAWPLIRTIIRTRLRHGYRTKTHRHLSLRR